MTNHPKSVQSGLKRAVNQLLNRLFLFMENLKKNIRNLFRHTILRIHFGHLPQDCPLNPLYNSYNQPQNDLELMLNWLSESPDVKVSRQQQKTQLAQLMVLDSLSIPLGNQLDATWEDLYDEPMIHKNKSKRSSGKSKKTGQGHGKRHIPVGHESGEPYIIKSPVQN